MRNIRHAIQSLEVVDCSLVVARKGRVEEGDDGFDVRGAVLWHVLADGLEVGPEVTIMYDISFQFTS